jgi:adenylate kinase family enzyme
VRRVVVVGNSGSGKSTLARRLATRLDVPHIELDSIHHQSGWTPLPPAELIRRVADATAGDGWVVDGNYSAVRAMVWERATTVVWFDMPRHVVMRRIVWRTLRRVCGRIELWNGNRERWRDLLTLDPERSVIAWAWQRHQAYRDRYAALLTDPACAHLVFIRIRRPADSRRLLSGVRRFVDNAG